MATINQIGLALSGSTGTGTFVGATAPTMANVTVDNLNLQTNTLSSSSGNINIVPAGASITAFTNGVTAATGSFTSGAAAGGFEGAFIAFSNTASKGSVTLECADNAGNFANVLVNASTSAARTWTLPDASGTLALTSGVPSLGDFTFSTDTMSTATTNTNMNLLPNGTGQLLVGSSTAILSASGTNLYSQIALGGKEGNLLIGDYKNDATSATIEFYKSRNTTIGSFTTVQTNDVLGSITAWGDDGTSFNDAASIVMTAVNTISTGVVPSKMVFSTTNTSGTLVAAATIDETQEFSLLNPMLGASGGTGIANTGLTINLSGGASNYVLTSDASGNATWQANPGSTGGLSWVNVAGTTQAAAVNSQYYCANAGATTVTLPATASAGSIVKIQGNGAGGWIFAANTGQTIQASGSVTSSGGNLTSAAATDLAQVTCIVANSVWRLDYTNSEGLTVN